MNDYIYELIPVGSEDKQYNCECMIVGENSGYEDYIGFWLSGGQIRKLWKGLEGIVHDWNIEFRFKAGEKVALSIICRNKSYVDMYLKKLDAPPLFEDNDKV